MSSDFTVVLPTRHHFGDEQSNLPGYYVGEDEKTFDFVCTDLRSYDAQANPAAILSFEAMAVEYETNVFKLNGNDIPGGIPKTPGGHHDWSANVMLVDTRWLQEGQNVLTVGSRNQQGNTGGDVDDFVLDNVVLMYKSVDTLIVRDVKRITSEQLPSWAPQIFDKGYFLITFNRSVDPGSLRAPGTIWLDIESDSDSKAEQVPGSVHLSPDKLQAALYTDPVHELVTIGGGATLYFTLRLRGKPEA